MLIAVPLVLLFAIILVRPIPKIGGEVRIGLLVAGVAAALLGGLGPIRILEAAVVGVDKLSWVIMLSVFGGIYAESQVRLGTMDAVLNSFRSLFGASTKGLVAAVIVTLTLAGSLLGDAIAAATVIGFLVIRSLRDLELTAAQIGAIIVTGAILGSAMPPISQAFFLSASLVGIEPGVVLPSAYVIMTLGVLVGLALGAFMVRHRKRLPAELVPDRSAWQILRANGASFIPMAVLALIVGAAALGYNVFERLPYLSSATAALASIPVVQGVTFRVVLAIIVALLVTLAFRPVRRDIGGVVKGGLTKVSKTVQIQLCAGFMVGAFYEAGLIDAVLKITEDLPTPALSIGGGAATIVVGMLTGSQTTAQTTIVTFLGPALTNLGIDAGNVAVGSALLAMAGQSFPPVGLTSFVVAGLVGGVLNVKVDPVRIMLYILPVTLFFTIVGFGAWFV